MIRIRSLVAMVAVGAALTLVAADVQARVGGGGSGGSRGSRTFSAPPVTRTAPTQAAPMQRTMTQPSAPATAGAATAASGTSRPGMFGGGMLGGLAAGFLGAGLLGMLFGGGFFSGMAGFASIFGMILQIGLIIIVVRLAMMWWQRRNQPAYARAATPTAQQSQQPQQSFFDSLRAGFGGGASGSGGPKGTPLTIGKSDYDAFELLLTDTQAAYSDENVDRLGELTTPEMLSYFAADLATNEREGIINRVRDVKLLQGDLAEAWSEGESDYATVAMRFSLDDRKIERSSGREVEGGPLEVTELWTFVRVRGGDWQLSAIQQT